MRKNNLMMVLTILLTAIISGCAISYQNSEPNFIDASIQKTEFKNGRCAYKIDQLTGFKDITSELKLPSISEHLIIGDCSQSFQLTLEKQYTKNTKSTY